MDRPWWWECADSEVRAAAARVWQRLPAEAQRKLADVKLYSVPGLTWQGQPCLGLARPGQRVEINSTPPIVGKVAMDETIAHEFAHVYLGHLAELAAVSADARKAIEPRQEAEVKRLLVAWGFGHERELGRVLIGD